MNADKNRCINDLAAKVEARFNDSVAGVFGLVSGASVLNAINFSLGVPDSLASMSSAAPMCRL